MFIRPCLSPCLSLLLSLVCLSARAESLLPLSRYARPPMMSPTLWLAIDTQPDAITADTQPLRRWIDALASEITRPWPAGRALPPEGLSLGLFAITQAGSAAETLHPAQPLDAISPWPAQTRSRQLSIIRNPCGRPDDDQTWFPGQTQSLTLCWPMPDAPAMITELSLDLPLRIAPARWPDGRLQFADGVVQDLPPAQIIDSGARARLSLRDAITNWQQAGHAGQLPPWPWRILLDARSTDEQGAWAAFQTAMPARVSIVWRDEAARRSGREQALRQLHGLLAGEGVQLPADEPALQQEMQRVTPASSNASANPNCPKPAVLRVSAALPDMMERLARWRDHQLAPAAIVTRQVTRKAGASLLGLDRDWSQPVPGRSAWPGGTEFHPCATADACELAPAPGFAHHSLRGLSHYLDAGPDASTATGRRGYLLWMAADGSLQLQDAQDGRWLWTQQPAPWASRRAELAQDAALDIGSADDRYAVRESDLAHWPDSADASPATGLDADGQRWFYGLMAGQLVTLDLTRPEQPRTGFLPVTGNTHPAQAHAWGSLSLLPLTLGSGSRQPLLLLAASDPAAAVKLLMLDGRTGQVLWQAGSASGAQATDLALTRGWRAAWRTLTAADGALLAYGVDASGGTWRLRIAPGSTQTSAIQVSLKRIADFSATGLLYPHPPSLAWLRDDQGQRQSAVALAGAATVSEAGAARSATVLAFLDSKSTTITAGDLPVWNTGTQPPAHLAGWQRTLSANAQIAQPPRWLDQQVLLASEVPVPGGEGCSPWAWQTRLHRWPWRAGISAAAGEAMLPIDARAVGDPWLDASGVLRWSGVSAASSEAASVMVPAASRQRVRQRQLRADD